MFIVHVRYIFFHFKKKRKTYLTQFSLPYTELRGQNSSIDPILNEYRSDTNTNAGINTLLKRALWPTSGTHHDAAFLAAAVYKKVL